MTALRRWGKAGVRLTPAEVAHRDREAVARRVEAEESRARALEIARRKWQEGMVVPNHITIALDAMRLHGPEVDAACLAEEPEVDLWEAGKLYPSWEQLCALAQLTGKHPSYFMGPPHGLPIEATSLRFHIPDYRDLPPRIYQFTQQALADAAAMGVRA